MGNFRATIIRANRKWVVGAAVVTLVVLAIVVAFCFWRQATAPESVGGPWTPIPDSPSCSIQLSAAVYKTYFLPGEPVPVDTVLRIRGPCTWRTYTSWPQRDFILIVNRTDPYGNATSLAGEETYWENIAFGWGEVSSVRYATLDTEHPLSRRISLGRWFESALTQTAMYDFSSPGEYTVNLIYSSPYEPHEIPANVVTFTRMPFLRNSEHTDGPPVPIPGLPDCSAQLRVEIDKQTLLPAEEVNVRAMFLPHGASRCKWRVTKSNPFTDFLLIVDRVDAGGSLLHLANEGTFWENATGWPPHEGTEIVEVDTGHPYSRTLSLTMWAAVALRSPESYDLSLPGIYTLRLIYLGRQDPYYVPSNVVTFTRLP